MKPIELYKKLPKKNCGICRQKTCMPFALAVLRGESDLSECLYLTQKKIDEIKSSLVQSDWREELILKLKEDIKNIKFSDVAEGIGAELKDGVMSIKCLGREFTIDRDGEIKTHGHITPWIKILLLHYVRTAGKGNLSGRWVSYSELKAGMIKASSFLRDCEEPLKDLFISDFDKTEKALNRLGAERREGFTSKYAYHLYLLPKIPVMIIYWPQEDEFDPKVKILFDSIADKFLDAEALIFLVEGLVKNIEALKNNY